MSNDVICDAEYVRGGNEYKLTLTVSGTVEGDFITKDDVEAIVNAVNAAVNDVLARMRSSARETGVRTAPLRRGVRYYFSVSR